MPPSASSNRPSRRAIAPVNAPFSWPNSSDSSIAGRQRGAVDAHERPRSRALLMWIARATISLPVPVSPRSSTVDVVGATCSTRAQHLAQRRRFADDGAEVELAVRVVRQHADVRRELLGEAPVLAHQREALDRVREDAAQLLRVPRLGDVAVDAPEVDRLDQHVDVRERGDDDADRVGADLARRLQQVEAGHLRHALVGDDRGDVFRPRQRQRLLAAAREQQLEAAPEVEAERVQVVRLVVDDQHRIFARSSPCAMTATVTGRGGRITAWTRDSSGNPAVFAEDRES